MLGAVLPTGPAWHRCRRPGWTPGEREPAAAARRASARRCRRSSAVTERRRGRRRHRRAVRPGGGRRGRRVRGTGAQGVSARLRPDRLGGTGGSRRGRPATRSNASRATGRPHCCRCRAGGRRAARARRWCGAFVSDDPVAPLADTQRLAVLTPLFPPRGRPHRRVTPLKAFTLGLNAERTLVRRAHGAHRQRRADAASGGRAGPEPRPARRGLAGRTRCATPRRAASTRRCGASSGNARRIAGA